MVATAEERLGADRAAGLHHDAFVSYSHQDRDFALRLRDALLSRGKSIWLDESGIRPAERWELALRRAIEGADAFVFVISPESAASAECTKEIQHAAELKKRIIPVVARPVAPEQVSQVLTSVQFVPPRGSFGDDFDASLNLLVSAIETDLDWVREHTEWAVKAVEWSDAKRDSSFLLSGSELEAAERWLAEQSGKRPEPTTLHNQFVLLSRRHAVGRLRRILGLAAAASVIVSMLAVIALILRSQAVSNQHIAQSRQYAQQGVAVLPSDPEFGTLLALKAIQVSATAQAETALRQALPQIQLIKTFSSRGAVRTAAYSPDGKKIVTAAENGTASTWDVATGRRLTTFTEPPVGGLGDPNFSIGGNKIASAVLSPDGSAVLTASWDTTARVSDATTGQLRSVLEGGRRPDQLNDATFSARGTDVVTATDAGEATIWIPTSPLGRQVLSVHEPGAAPVESAVFNRTGTMLLTASLDGTARLWRASTGRLLRVFTEPKRAALFDAAFRPDGSEIVTASADGTARIWNAASGHELITLGIRSGANLQTAKFSPDGHEVVTAGDGPTVTVWDAATGEQLTLLHEPQGARLSSASFSPDGNQVLTSSNDGSARIWDAYPRALIQHVAATDRAPLHAAALNPTGSEVALASSDGMTRIFNASSGRQLANLAEGTNGQNYKYAGNGLNTVVFNRDGSRVLTASRDGTARIWDAQTGRQLLFLQPAFVVSSAAFNAQGTEVVTANDAGSVDIYDARTGHHLADFSAGVSSTPDGLFGAAFNPAGTEIVTAADNGVARVYTTSGHQMQMFTEPHNSPIGSAVFSPNGRRVLTASDDSSARVWDVASGRQLLVVRDPHGARFYGADFNRDGSELVTASGSGTATIWNASTGKQLTTLGYAEGVTFYTAAFSRTGQEVLTSGYDGLASVWSTALATPLVHLEHVARALITSGITRGELGSYTGQISKS